MKLYLRRPLSRFAPLVTAPSARHRAVRGVVGRRWALLLVTDNFKPGERPWRLPVEEGQADG